MFADYRIPQILRHYHVMNYSEELATLIDSYTEIPFGSEYEAEIRAATVIAVEKLKLEIAKVCNIQMKAVEIDWLLWNLGENMKDTIKPHHRTRTIYY
jgi:hypothetical protein